VAETVLMDSFGENLRREREMRGVTLEEISAATKISVRFLKSIEGEDFSKLPGGIFNRSFIRSYARYLGLDEDPLIAEYQLAAKAKGEVDLTRLSLPVSHYSRNHRSRSAWVGVAAAVVLLVAGYGLWRHSQGSREVAPPRTKQVSPQNKLPNPSVPAGSSAAMDSPEPAPTHSSDSRLSPARSNGPTGTAQSTHPDATPAPLAESGPPAAKAPANVDYGNSLVLQIATTERAWVAIDADGKTAMQGIMNPNEVKTLKAQDSFDVLTGNAQGVILTLNGQTLKPLGREGEVKSIHLTRDSLKNPNSP
jgi:cytoskeleton protein RodZ